MLVGIRGVRRERHRQQRLRDDTVTVGYPDCDDLTIYFGIVEPVPPAGWNSVFYLDNVRDTCCACEPDPPPVFTDPYPPDPDSTEQAIYELLQSVLDPTPVRLTGFRATGTDEGVSIQWSYLLEDFDNAGFNLYRSVDESDDYRLLNTDGLLVGESPFRFVDSDVQPGHTYSYMLGALDLWGVEMKFGPVTASWMGMNAGSELLACYPSPTSGSTTISYRLRSASHVDLSVYDTQGRLVRTLVRGVAGPGLQDVTWDGCDNDGRKVSAGIYHCELKVDGLEDSKKITLVE